MRTAFGRCSFEIPAGYRLLEQACLAEDTRTMPMDFGLARQPVSITLMREDSMHHPDATRETGISYDPKDLEPQAWPVTMTLTSMAPVVDIPPGNHARMLVSAMESHLRNFRPGFIRNSQIGDYKAVELHYSFDVHFRLDSLAFIWKIQNELLTTSVTVRPSDVLPTWPILRRFAESVSLA